MCSTSCVNAAKEIDMKVREFNSEIQVHCSETTIKAALYSLTCNVNVMDINSSINYVHCIESFFFL